MAKSTSSPFPRSSLFPSLWSNLGGSPALLSSLTFDEGRINLPSVYPVSEFAATTVGLATLAVSEWEALRNESEIRSSRIDCDHASLAFRSERYLARPAEPWPSLWDPMAGDYATRDGFIRLHTNYPHHRAAAERVLGSGEDHDRVAREIARRDAVPLESEVVAEGGCAAALHSQEEWQAHPQGSVVHAQPPFDLMSPVASLLVSETVSGSSTARDRLGRAPIGRPLAGVRVLDLTRVIAGPTCTRLLAAWGADVLRIDPVGFDEGAGLLADTTVGKRCAALDLREAKARQRFAMLVAEADVLVVGYRSDALGALGFDRATLREANPLLVIAALDAYGFEGPWKARRGFDSLVQMSCGIAARGQAVYGTAMPKPLPAQALDHGTGYLLAAAVCRGLTQAHAQGACVDAQLSLAGTATALMDMGENGDPEAPEPVPSDVEPYLLEESGPFGAIRRVACPGKIGDDHPEWTRPAGQLGADAAEWPTG